MEYTYNIINDVYYWMLSKEKNIEVRLLKEKSAKIHIGDYITFNNQDKQGKYIKVKVINKEIFNNSDELLNKYDVNRMMPKHTEEELKELLNKIYGDQLKKRKLVAFEFKYITSDLEIEEKNDKEPYIKELTKDKIINLTGQSGSGKSTYAKKNLNTNDYLIIDTDDIFNEERFKNATGINKELGKYLREKYKELPNLGNDFDIIYNEIVDYCSKYNKTIVIDCAQFHCIKEITKLKGKIIILRTSIDTCYQRCINRYKENNQNASEEEIYKYTEKKKSIYSWYKYTNEFILKIDRL